MVGSLVPYGYNIALGGARGRHSQATKLLIGSYHKGKIVSQEARDLMSQNHLGIPLSKETKANISNGLKRFYVQKDLENPIYLFDCKTHESICAPELKSSIVEELDVSIHSLRRSLKSRTYKFKMGDRWCYARFWGVPETGMFFNFGRKVIIQDEDGTETMYASLVDARNALNLSRGVIEGCISRGGVSSYNDEFGNNTFTATYADV
jgi:hypothetical protein